MNIQEQERRAHLLTWLISNSYRSITPEGEQALKEYTSSGDINVFINKVHALFDLRVALESHDQSINKLLQYEGKRDNFLSFCLVFFIGDEASLDALKHRLRVFTEWVMQDPEFRGTPAIDFKNEISLAERFSRIFYSLFHDFSAFFTNEIWQEVFLWIYGEKFDPNRQFPMTFGAEQWRPELWPQDNTAFYLDNHYFNILSNVDRYFFISSEDEYDYYARYQPLVRYLLPLLPKLNKACYRIERFKNFEKDQNGNVVNYNGWQAMIRRFIAHMHGIYDSYELEDNGLPIPPRDPELLAYFKQEFAKLDMPTEYYSLEKFVLEKGSEYLSEPTEEDEEDEED